MMRIGRHKNVVHMYEVLEMVQDSKSTMFLILELVRGGELFDLISSNSGSKRKKESASSANEIHEVTMRKFFMELALGINFIHSSGVAHRDLKPEVSLDSCTSFHHSVIPFLCSFNIGYSHIGCLEFANQILTFHLSVINY